MKKYLIVLTFCLMALSSSAQVYFYSDPKPYEGDKYFSIGAGYNFANPTISFTTKDPHDPNYGDMEANYESLKVDNNVLFSFRFDGLENVGQYCAGGPHIGVNYSKEGFLATFDGADLYGWAGNTITNYPSRRYECSRSAAQLNVEVGWHFGGMFLDERLFVGVEGVLFINNHLKDTFAIAEYYKNSGNLKSSSKRQPESFCIDFGLGVGLSAYYLLTDHLFVAGHVSYQAFPFFSPSLSKEFSSKNFVGFPLDVAAGKPHDINVLFSFGYRFEGTR